MLRDEIVADQILNLTMPSFLPRIYVDQDLETWNDALEQAIERSLFPEEFKDCSPASPIESYVHDLLSPLDANDIATFFLLREVIPISQFIIDYKIIWDQDDSDDYIGINGAQTQKFMSLLQHQRLFWNLSYDNILLQGLHGAILADLDEIVAFLNVAYKVDLRTGREIVEIIQQLLDTSSLGFEFPLWTFTVYSFQGHKEEFGSIPPKVCIGDGLLDFFNYARLSEIGGTISVALETARHVQDQLSSDPDYPLLPRDKTEKLFMGDVVAGYYLSHPRGASVEAAWISKFYQTSFDPQCHLQQRSSASQGNIVMTRNDAVQWGSKLAQAVRGKGMIRTARDVLDAFHDQYSV